MLCSCFRGTLMMLDRRTAEDVAGPLRRFGQDRELRDVVVPLHNRGDVAKPPRRALVQQPYFVANRMVVRVEQVSSVVAMPREMILHDALDRDRVDIVVRI